MWVPAQLTRLRADAFAKSPESPQQTANLVVECGLLTTPRSLTVTRSPYRGKTAASCWSGPLLEPSAAAGRSGSVLCSNSSAAATIAATRIAYCRAPNRDVIGG